MKIVFFGTSEFAVPSLDSLNKEFELVAVITAPDKRGGRGRKQFLASPVKKFAEENGLMVLQPTNLKSGDFIDQLQSFRADLFVVVAFRMLPKIVWDMPPMGTINLHASLLPAYRGAAPINHAIIQGENTTGMTVFKLDEKIDTGDLLCKEIVEIHPTENAGDLHDRMAVMGGPFLVNCIKNWISGKTEPNPQDSNKASHAPKLNKEFCELDFNLPAQEVLNKIRGLSPFPGAFTFIDGLELKIFSAELLEFSLEDEQVQSGKIKTDGKSYLCLSAIDKWINCRELQLEGKKRMPVRDFLNGWGKKLPDFIS